MENRYFLKSKVFFFTLLVYFSLNGLGICQGWPDIKVRMLPDSSFAVIEKDKNGYKYRRCPHHDINGDIDSEQLIYVIGT